MINMVRTRPMIVAHRGFSGYYPENTLRAFEEALKLPIDAIEIDVRRTKDGTLVVMHDEAVDRTTNGNGHVSEFTLSEIEKLDAGSWKGKEFLGTRIPTLNETLEFIKQQTMLLVEIKEPGTEREIIDIINHHKALKWVNLVSFHSDALLSAKRTEPQISCALIGGEDIGSSDESFADFVSGTLSCGANSVMVHYTTLTPERVHYCHKHFLSIGTWTVDSRDLANRLIAMGVDAIATNRPDVVLALLAA